MRIIKLSDASFEGIESVEDFFEDKLRSKKPSGKFEIPKNKIASDGLKKGEKLIFTYEAKVRYIAESLSTRKENQNVDKDRKIIYPYCFIIDMDTLFKVDDVDIRDIISLNQQSWTKVRDNDEIKIWERCTNKKIQFRNFPTIDTKEKAEKKVIFSEEEAEEGYLQDKNRKFRKRNQGLINERKKRDNYTCKVCGFRLEIAGKYIIDCHHTKPLGKSSEIVITHIDDLICLCPICHRIAHTRRIPLTLKEIEKISAKPKQIDV